MDVVIDDKLPTIDGRLLFAHSKDQNEFWPALMEKAYAKYEKTQNLFLNCCILGICNNSIISACARVCGSYTDMVTGTPAEAMMDFTGGVHISVELSDPPPNLWQLMCSAGQSSSLMGCGTPQGVIIRRTNTTPSKQTTSLILD